MKQLLCVFFFLSAGCAGNNLVTAEEFNSKINALEEENRQQNLQIESIRECESWRSRYKVENRNCISGLTEETITELETFHENLTEEVFSTRRHNACEFACVFEIGCQHETRTSCLAAGFDTNKTK